MTKKSYVDELRQQLPSSCYVPRDNVIINYHPDPEIQAWIRCNSNSAGTYEMFKDCAFIKAGYRKYKQHASFQQGSLIDGYCLRTLTDGLKRLDLLQSVVLIGQWPYLRRPNDRRTGTPLLRSWNNFHCSPHNWQWDSRRRSFMNDGSRHYEVIVSALVTSQRCIGAFDVGGLYCSGLQCIFSKEIRRKSMYNS